MTLFIAAINLLFILGIGALAWRNQDQTVRPVFWPALGIKLAVGIGLGLIYQRYYGSGDTFYFFDQGKDLTRLFHTDSGAYFNFLWQDAGEEWKGSARSVFFVKIVSVFAIVSGGNYWTTSLWFSFLSFLGSLYLVVNILRFFPGSKFAAAFAFLFFPSVIFWGSGIIKESVALAGLLVLSVIFLKAMMNKMPRPIELIVGLISFWIVWNLKYYWIAVFLPVAITSWTVHRLSTKFSLPKGWQLVLWVAVFFVLCLGASLSHPNFYLERFLQVVVENNRAFVAISNPSELISYESLRPTWQSIVSNAPWALISGLFRPFPWEANTVLKVAVSLENTVLLVLVVSSLRNLDLFRSSGWLIALSVLCYVFLLCVFLALSTPNLGSLARYKVGFLPFLIFLTAFKNPLIEKLFRRSAE